MAIRKALGKDLEALDSLIDAIHTAEEAGEAVIGWKRGVYPTRATMEAALDRDDLFVMEDDRGEVVGVGIINKLQVDVYEGAPWTVDAPADQVMVLHTLMIHPGKAGQGFGGKFEAFYEEYAALHGCPYLRIDTNERNLRARSMYRKLGYREIGIVPTVFNGIPGVGLVLLEKILENS